MHSFLRCFLLLSLIVAPAFAQTGRLGDVVVNVDKVTVPVRVSATTPELNALAQLAFRSHGRYRLVASGFQYDIRFSVVSGSQVRLEISQGSAGTPVAAPLVVTGPNVRTALLRAADVAVERTNGMGLKGFFTARLAFVGETGGKKEVYVSDLFLGETSRITNHRSQVLTPRFSPDGQRLLFTSYYKSGAPDIFQYDMRTYLLTSFVSLRGTNMGARYSPNGQQVAMVLSGEGSSEIYVSNAQGKLGPASRKTRSELVKASPAWSPDGNRIVFAMGDSSPQLYVMGAAGGTPQRLVTGFAYAAEPDWSRADSRKIACTVKVGRGYQIAVYDFSTGRAKQVSDASFDAIEPCWLADGRHLVFTARASNGATVLSILDTETGQSTAISRGFTTGMAMHANVWTP